jgi:exodeoxyribonuclease V beta subunit
MDRFDLLGPLPAESSTTVLEASAGTGKTFALAGLVTRYVAEDVASLEDMLLITFGRAASRELRERVRSQIRDAAIGLEPAADAGDNELIGYLRDAPRDVVAARGDRLWRALSGFDAATIATTHQFCQLVLKSLGAVGDADSSVRLADNVDDLLGEVVDDLYLARFGQDRDDPPFTRELALRLARGVVGNPAAHLRPANPPAGSEDAARLAFAADVLAELEHRKRRLGIMGYDDLLSRLAAALEPPDSPARERMSQRWRVVMVDEFQDTDPVQWQVVERAFVNRSTVILIGDPKQAIYGFRGGDIVTYLEAARRAGRRTLGFNWRGDAALVASLQAVLHGAALGHPDIVVREVEARHQRPRLVGAPRNAPFRLRVVRREQFGVAQNRTIPIDRLRRHIGADLASDITGLLSNGASFDGRALRAADIAVIVEKHRDARSCHEALTAAGVPAVYTGDTDVFTSQAAQDWLCLLEAFDQPHRSGLVRAAAATMFFGETARTLAAGGDALTDRIAATLRAWADHARERGVAAVYEAARLSGMARRVLSWQGGERHLTDLAHVTELLHETAHREHYGLPALRDWLRGQCDGAASPEGVRNRRLDSDAAAVQIMTVWVSKGLQYPVVYLPYAFNRYIDDAEFVLHHEDTRRCLHIGGKDSPDHDEVRELGRIEAADNDIRLTYVGLTRAQSQVVAWWAPSRDEPNGGLSRLMRGRDIGASGVPARCSPVEKLTDDDAARIFGAWQDAGGPVVEDSVAAPAVAIEKNEVPTDDLAARHFHRSIDTQWRRTSYSGLIRAAERSGVRSEPEIAGKDDEVADLPAQAGADGDPAGPGLSSPMADVPGGAALGSLVHAVLEGADPTAPDLGGELERHVRANAVWWPSAVGAEQLANALLPLYDTPLGPLADGLTLRAFGRRDRLSELAFEIPLAQGDSRTDRTPDIRLRHVGDLIADTLPAVDPVAAYADRLRSAELGGQSLRGYLSGSIDAILRLRRGPADGYLVVDYKTNRLGDPSRRLTAADYAPPLLTRAMLHSDYPLQALLYSVVLHRYLRWRQPGYDPDRHYAGVLYLFVRGMCGQRTPLFEGVPAGVFGWRPPSELLVALSDLLDRGRPPG